MDGTISLESEPGKGSCFSFTMRTTRVTVPASHETAASVIRPGMRVLVVDDSATARDVLSRTLTEWGARPTGVAAGWDALHALQQGRAQGEPFRLVLLDTQMPGVDGFELLRRIGAMPGPKTSVVAMLSSAGGPREIRRCRDLGVAVPVLKPVNREQLREAIATALGETATLRTTSAHIPPAGDRPVRILLAEDNAVNQLLAVRLLEKRGHTVVVAATGRETVNAFERERFDVVLMDIQMPDMDGLEAAAAIRAHERERGGHVPIVALTAHAMKSDRDRCLEAGMDAYLSKPLRPAELFETIAQLLSGVQPVASSTVRP
jgi:two-component system sensor histidine kinase/response regulator